MSDSPTHEASGPSGSGASPSAPGSADSAVPSFLPVPVRARHDGWTPERQRGFIEVLADTLCPVAAARAVGMTAQGAYALRRRADAGGFAAAWSAAMRSAIRHRLATLAIDKAVNGTIVRRYYHGELVSEERVHSEKLLLWLLEKGERLLASDPEAEEADKALADWDGWMERLGTGEMDGGFRIWRNNKGKLVTNFPPPAGFASYWKGDPGEPDYERSLTPDELEAHEARVAQRLEDGDSARER
ncbi:MAG TPA: hypothetical protein VGR19_11135, partial [Allosphingosinicella sp.]|nr:hypothetical protein [Allosphingosinicella sp.]